MSDPLAHAATVTLSAEWEHRADGVVSWRLAPLDDRAPAPPGAHVTLDLSDVPASTAEVVDAVRRLTGAAASVHVVGGARPATRALLVASLLALGDGGRGSTGRQWSGVEQGAVCATRGDDLAGEVYAPALLWLAGIEMRNRDDEDAEAPGHEGESVDLGGPE